MLDEAKRLQLGLLFDWIVEEDRPLAGRYESHPDKAGPLEEIFENLDGIIAAGRNGDTLASDRTTALQSTVVGVLRFSPPPAN
jgi:hypothetical protein